SCWFAHCVARHAIVRPAARVWRRRRSSGGRRREPEPKSAPPRGHGNHHVHRGSVGDRGSTQDLAGMKRRPIRWFKYASPGNLYRLAGTLIPWFAVPAGVLFALGAYLGLFIAPTDFQQGDAYRVLFVHVPAAWLGMLLYIVLAFYAAVGWV